MRREENSTPMHPALSYAMVPCGSRRGHAPVLHEAGPLTPTRTPGICDEISDGIEAARYHLIARTDMNSTSRAQEAVRYVDSPMSVPIRMRLRCNDLQVPAYYADQRSTRPNSSEAPPQTEAIGQSIIYSIRYPHVFTFIVHYGRSDARLHDEDAGLEKRLSPYNVVLILRRAG
jgi:hypothetical protein